MDRKRYFMANTVIFNGVEFKSATAVKAQARINTMDVVVSALKTAYGEDKVAKVGSNEYGVIVGEVTDKDGFPQEVVVTVKPTVKEWESRKTDKRTYTQFILADEAQAYEMETKKKEEKKAEEKAKREKAKVEKEKENSAE